MRGCAIDALELEFALELAIELARLHSDAYIHPRTVSTRLFTVVHLSRAYSYAYRRCRSRIRLPAFAGKRCGRGDERLRESRDDRGRADLDRFDRGSSAGPSAAPDENGTARLQSDAAFSERDDVSRDVEVDP